MTRKKFIHKIVTDMLINGNAVVIPIIKDGLIDNEVHHLAQDTMGYIWAGTENGLSRFDGHYFTSFTQDSDPNLVSGNYIEKLHISDGKLLVLAREGFSIIETALITSRQY